MLVGMASRNATGGAAGYLAAPLVDDDGEMRPSAMLQAPALQGTKDSGVAPAPRQAGSWCGVPACVRVRLAVPQTRGRTRVGALLGLR